jgi:NADH-quinone oxidoreductase subunit E
MLSAEMRAELEERIASAEHPRELAIEVMTACQEAYGYLSDEAVAAAAGMLAMTPLEIEELATFYNFIYREPVGRYVIHICDSVICWMEGYTTLLGYLCRRLGIRMGETTADGLFTLLPACCLGYCDRAPAMMINRTVYGYLTPEKIDEIIERLRGKGMDEAMKRDAGDLAAATDGVDGPAV